MRGDAGGEETAIPADEDQAGVNLRLGSPDVQASQQPGQCLLGSRRVGLELRVVIVGLRKLWAELERAPERILGGRVPLLYIRALDQILREHAFEPAEPRPRRGEAIVGREALAVQRSGRCPCVWLPGELIGLEVETVGDLAVRYLRAVARLRLRKRQRRHDRARHAVLELEEVVEGSVGLLCPRGVTGPYFDELRRHANPRARAQERAGQDEVGVQLDPGALHVAGIRHRRPAAPGRSARPCRRDRRARSRGRRRGPAAGSRSRDRA